jgi:SAM-dependent methyltransferase
MTFSTGWWSTFFSGPMLTAQRQMYGPDATRADAEFLAKALRLEPGSRVLDVPCGNGRIALELASRGYRATGIDQAAEMIEEARGRAAEQGLAAAFEVRDMRDLPFEEEFEGAFCFGNSFAYMDDEANAAFLEAIRGALRPGGRFVLETGSVAESVLLTFEPRAWYRLGEMLFLAGRRYDPVEGRLYVDYTVVQDGRVETRPASYRIYTYRELCGIFQRAGLEVIASSSSLTGEPYGLGSRNLYLTARKEE